VAEGRGKAEALRLEGQVKAEEIKLRGLSEAEAMLKKAQAWKNTMRPLCSKVTSGCYRNWLRRWLSLCPKWIRL